MSRWKVIIWGMVGLGICLPIALRAHTPFSGMLLPAGGCGAGLSLYVGPGDIVTGASAYFGVRAYNATYADNCSSAFDLRRADNATMTAKFLTTGALDTATISAWAAGQDVFVSKAYDQTGNGRHVLQGTTSSQPQLFLSGGPGNFPYLASGNTSVKNLSQSGTFTPATGVVSLQALGLRVTGPLGAGVTIAENDVTGNAIRPRPGVADSWQLQGGAGGNVNKTALSDSAWHDLQGVVNGASSNFRADGSNTTGTAPGNTTAGPVVFASGGSSLTFMQHSEGGFWDNLAMNTTQTNDLHNNLRAYYGF